jgi:biopolymer transport protein ExbB
MIKNNSSLSKKGFIARLVMLVLVLAAISIIVAFAKTSAPDSPDVHPEDSKSFFAQFIISGGPIVWFILLPMSVLGLYLAIDTCFLIRRKRLLPLGVASNIALAAGKLGPARFSDKVSSGSDLVSKAFVSAITQARQPGSDKNQLRLLAAESLNEQALVLLRKIEWFNIIGNVAPMIGLFGTVFGMIKAFNLLGVSGGQPRPDQLAAAISIALITTFWGLLVAIPSLAIYGIFRTRIEALVSEAALEIEALFRRVILTTPAGPAALRKTNVPLQKFQKKQNRTADEKIILPLNSVT